jgi:hypothetical protein
MPSNQEGSKAMKLKGIRKLMATEALISDAGIPVSEADW